MALWRTQTQDGSHAVALRRRAVVGGGGGDCARVVNFAIFYLQGGGDRYGFLKCELPVPVFLRGHKNNNNKTLSARQSIRTCVRRRLCQLLCSRAPLLLQLPLTPTKMLCRRALGTAPHNNTLQSLIRHLGSPSK